MSKKLSEKLWWRKLAFAGAAIAMLPLNLLAQDADNGDEELEELEAFTMIGSRISRVDAEPISPVIQFDSKSLKNSGYSSIADAIRSLPINNGQSLTPSDAGTSFTPGVSTMNLRGLGNNYSLVLLNGRRAAPYALPGFNGLQSVFDINSIPEAAIKNIQILTDGASAIYGSDAVAGVADFQLRTDFDGFATDITIGNFIDTDGFYRQVNAVYGVTTADDSIVVAVSYARQEAVYARDLDYTSNADNSYDDVKNGHWELDDPEQAATDGVTLADWEAYWGGSPADSGEWDQRSALGYPGMVVFGGDFDGETYETYYYTATEPTDNLTSDNIAAGYHTYNYEDDSLFLPSYERYSIYTHIKHDITDNLYAFAEVTYSRTDSTTESAPAPVNMSGEHGLTSDDSMVIPEYNAYNPFGVELTTAYRRLIEAGNRSTDTTAEAPRVVAGLGGDLAGDWTWEVGLLHSENRVDNNSKVVTDSRLQQALMGLTRDSDGSLVWNPSTPTGEREYFNWFGENSDEMGDYLTEDNLKSGSFVLESFDFNFTGSIFELASGNVGLNIGGEYRKEDVDVHQTYLNEKGMIVGGSEGTSFDGSRNVRSLYAETVIPVTKWMELQLAGRYENYSDDGFSDSVRPKIAFKIKPFECLAIRGSFSKSFKAPDLAYLYMSSSTSFSSGNIPDPVTGVSKQVKIVTGGNEDLAPETTDSYYLGAVFSPTSGLLEDFTFSVDYVRYDISGVMMQLSDIYGYSDFLRFAAAGDTDFVDLVVRDSNNELLYILDDYKNLGEAKLESLDFKTSYFYETEKYGTFSTELSATYRYNYTVDGDQVAGTRTAPKWRGTWKLGWKKGDWSAFVYTNYIGARDHLVGYSHSLSNLGSDSYVVSYYDMDAQFVVNPSISYSGLWQSTITLGVNNVFNSAPPSDPREGIGYLAGVNYGQPFYWYLRFSKEF